MPVVVTGANGRVGLSLIPLLLEKGSEVRAVVRRPDAAEAVRALGAKVAIAGLADREKLTAVLRDAHSICHLAGTINLPSDDLYEESNVGTTRDVLEAAAGTGIRRILYLSSPGASPGSTNAHLRAKGEAEDLIRASGLEHVILRCTFMIGPGSRWLEAMAEAARRPVAIVVGPGTQRVAPVFLRDVARTLVAADDREASVSGTFGLQGPDVATADEVVDLIAGRRKRKLHISPGVARRLAPLMGRRVSKALVEIFAADSLADAPDAAAEFGIERTSLPDALRVALSEETSG